MSEWRYADAERALPLARASAPGVVHSAGDILANAAASLRCTVRDYARFMALMVQAALHAPDHAELVPYRFKLVRGEARAQMASLFAAAARAAGKGEEGAALDAERALKPPVTVAVVAVEAVVVAAVETVANVANAVIN